MTSVDDLPSISKIEWKDCCAEAYEKYEMDFENHRPNAYGFHDIIGTEGPFDCNGCGVTWVMNENWSEEEDPECEFFFLPYLGKKGMRYDSQTDQWIEPEQEQQ